MKRTLSLIPSTLLVLVGACTPAARPPVVTPQPPAAARSVAVTIRNAPRPNATLLTDDGRRVECALATLADGVPRAVCVLHPDTPDGWGAHLTVTAPERLAQTIDFSLAPAVFSDGLPDIALAAEFIPLPRLVVDGQFFTLATGEPWTGVLESDFDLLGREAAGEDVEPVLEQRARAGYNWARVFTAYDVPKIGRLWPSEHPDLYSTVIPRLSRKAARHGLYIEYVGFTGPYPFFSGTDAMVAHWNALTASACADTNNTLELVNEFDHPANKGVPLELMQRPPPPCLASHGSAVQDSAPVQPFWDYITFHSAEPRKIVHNCWSDYADPSGRPCVVNETGRAPDNEDSLAHWQDVGRGCALMVAGCAFHSVHGKDSTLWTGKELELATAFAQFAHAVPLVFQQGQYTHRDDLEPGPAPCPCVRVYSKRLPGREYIAPIRP